jgi:hypothetical protein
MECPAIHNTLLKQFYTPLPLLLAAVFMKYSFNIALKKAKPP